jgi:hypothetical protein
LKKTDEEEDLENYDDEDDD